MTSVLRPIAIHVEEPAAGTFRWVLIERDDGSGTWAPIQKSGAATDTYRQAMADGLLALQSMIEDLDVGPRLTAQKDIPANHHRSDDAASADDAEEAQPRTARPTLFGFGSAR
ncbi:hypothetical protein [Acidovorax sp. SUPP3334]|uniref:hypothetical protein n=1 Tax=Acidovorax sp. SUPP3334 TaxID=2920881 RepID=UPI0023DE348E|nr:hypothetical protein [Acidovorax sp. SUPP3334]GKT20911.1 hypothetical protein AVHM3334_02850 [Acidovorax sp. SUPP3334]